MGHTGNLSGQTSTRSMWIGEQNLDLTFRQTERGAWFLCAAAWLPQITGFRALPQEALWP